MERERSKKSWREVDQMRDRSAHRKAPGDKDRRRDEVSRHNTEARQSRSALEALFSEKKDGARTETKGAPRIVAPPNPDADPRNAERRRLLAKFLRATGPGPISKVANEFLTAGFVFPEDQEVHLQLLEHTDEERVREAIDGLARLFAGQIPKRKPVLEQRLRRIETQADEASTREAATTLRRILHGRGTPLPPGTSR